MTSFTRDMQTRLKVGSESKPKILVAKGCFEPMGVRKDIMRVIPSLMDRFQVSVATLRSSKELEKLCSNLGLELLIPDQPWIVPNGIFDEILHRKQRASFRHGLQSLGLRMSWHPWTGFIWSVEMDQSEFFD